MSTFLLYGGASAVLVALSIFALIAHRNLIRKIIALNVLGSGVFLLFGAIAQRAAGNEPDPVPHAMVLTGIVVAVSATAFALALVRRIHAKSGRATLSEREGLE